MKRRTFFSASLATTAAGLGGCGNGSVPATDNPQAIGMIGTKSIQELREQFRYDLFDDFLAFFDAYIVDYTYGGFMTNVRHDGSHVNEEKRGWYLGRGSWCYSYLYNNIAKEQRYLDIAEGAVKMIMRHVPSGDDFWPDRYTRDGEVIQEKGGLAGDCYIAEGLAEFAKATGEKKYMDLAKETMRKCWRHYERADFQDGASPYPGARNLWYWMLFMWFGTNNLAFEPDSELEQRTKTCVSAIMDHHWHPKFDLMNNVINHDLSRSDDPKHSELAGCGHATEALWMLMYEAIRTKDKALFDLAAERFKRHVDVSWDDVYGGVFNDCRNVDENIWQLNKIHWAEVFVLMGSLPVIEHTNAQWAKEMFDRQNTWTQENFTLKPEGFALWKATTDRKATFVPDATGKDIYHHPRFLMLNFTALERIIARNGIATGMFA